MKETTYGYRIGEDIQVDVELGVVARLYTSRKLKFYSAEAIFLGETPMQLLVYLLERVEREVVLYSDILHHIWDDRGLISSYKGLNKVVAELREKLKNLGLEDDFISTVRGKGYRLKTANVKRLYTKSIKSKNSQLISVM
ncbi:winged helix-turn-helix domain-containing protein [Serratia aquatilis]|uniref:Transcriptional regulator n=1 Tax=Serratia aquatilis TaxID=1737515 RepID=A0ABV6ED57_9GAMM